MAQLRDIIHVGGGCKTEVETNSRESVRDEPDLLIGPNKSLKKLSFRRRKRSVVAMDEQPLTPPHGSSDSSSDEAMASRIRAIHSKNRVYRGRRVLVNGMEREACAHGTIPLRVCFLEPPNVEDQRHQGKSEESVVNMPTLPAGEPGMLLPPGEFSDTRGFDLVVAPELLVIFAGFITILIFVANLF